MFGTTRLLPARTSRISGASSSTRNPAWAMAIVTRLRRRMAASARSIARIAAARIAAPPPPWMVRAAAMRASRSAFRPAARRHIGVPPRVPVPRRTWLVGGHRRARPGEFKLYGGLRRWLTTPVRVRPAQEHRDGLIQRCFHDRPGRWQNRPGGQASRPFQRGHRCGVAVRTARHHRPGNRGGAGAEDRRGAERTAMGRGINFVHDMFIY